MKNLTELANYHCTDKGTEGPNGSGHYYTDIYEALFYSFRHQPINVLEIGLGVKGENVDVKIVKGRNKGGASIKMWHDYFTNAKIFGIDLNEASWLENDRIKTFQLDQGSVSDLQSFISHNKEIKFDIIIDDGSHLPHHQQISLSLLFNRLKKGGFYIIEDLLENDLEVNNKMILNTREILKNINKNQKLLQNHSLLNKEELIENIAHINFYVRQSIIKHQYSGSLRKPLGSKLYYLEGKEKLCVIRKK